MDKMYFPYNDSKDDNYNIDCQNNFVKGTKESFTNPEPYYPKTNNIFNNNIESFANNSNNYVWGINKNDNIYRKKESTNDTWQKMNDSLTNVSASNKDYVWGVNKEDDVYVCKKPCNDSKWKHIDGKLKQVSGGEKEVWGINSANNIYKKNIDGSGPWSSMEGQLTNISASGKDYIWGVNNNISEIKLRVEITTASVPDAKLTILNKIKEISLLYNTKRISPSINVTTIKPFNDSIIYIDFNVSKNTTNINTLDIELIDKPIIIINLKISIKDSFGKYITILNDNTKKAIKKDKKSYNFDTIDISKHIPRIYRCKNECDGNWEHIKGDIDMISASSKNVWGIKDKNVYKRLVDGEDNDWLQIPGSLKNISASSNDYIWGVDDSNKIFKCKQPCNEGNWESVNGDLKQISGGYNNIEIKGNTTEKTLLDKVIKQHKTILQQNKKEKTIKENIEKEYLLLARQTVNGVFFPKNTLNTSQFNEKDPNDINYMNGKLLTDKYKFNDKYIFKLVWPDSNFKEQIWKQSSNPFTSNTVSNYEPIEVHYNDNFWGGLRNGVGDSVLSGSMNGSWFYAVGAYEMWSGGIPGPNKSVSQVELYVRKNDIIPEKKIIKEDEKGCRANYGQTIPCCGQPGNNVSKKYICPKENPYCINYKINKTGGRCASIDKNNKNSYLLKFHSSGREGYSGANKIQILVDKNVISEFTPPINKWKEYSIPFTNQVDNFQLTFKGLFGADKGDHSSALSGIHLLKNKETVFNNNFSNPQLKFNSYKTIKNDKDFPSWDFNAVLVNNSTAWNYKIPYPNGNQIISIQNKDYIIKNINNKNNSNKKIDAANKEMKYYKTLVDDIKIPSQEDVSMSNMGKILNIPKNSLGILKTNSNDVVDFYENFSNNDDINTLADLTTVELTEKNNVLLQQYNIQTNQLKEISEKEKVYHKNSKMLKIAQDKNIFKKKIISTLSATIFFFLILIIAMFVYYKRKLK